MGWDIMRTPKLCARFVRLHSFPSNKWREKSKQAVTQRSEIAVST